MSKMIVLFSSAFVLAACSPGESGSDKYEAPSDIEQGIVAADNSNVYSNLSVEAERIVEKYEKLDDIKVGNDDIEVTKLQSVTDISGNERTNNFRITGDYVHGVETYEFITMISYKENDFDSGFYVLYYNSTESGELVKVEFE